MRVRAHLIIVLALALSASACSNNGTDTPASEATESAESTEASEAAGGEPSEADSEDTAAQDFTVGVSNLGLSFPFPASIGEGIKSKAEELGVEVVELDAEGDASKQTNDVDDLVAQGVDGVLLLPVDSGIAERIVDSLEEASIPVVAVASQVGDPEERDIEDVYEGLVALVTQAEVEAGEKAAEIVLDIAPEGGDVAIVEGAAGFAEVRTRAVGFEEVLGSADADYEIVARQPGDWVPDTAESACQNMLASNPDVAVFYAQSDDMAVGCAEAVEAAGSKAQVVGIGGSKLGIDAVDEGTVAGTVCYKPADMGELAMEVLYGHLTGEEPLEAEFITYETPAITADNVTECDPQW